MASLSSILDTLAIIILVMATFYSLFLLTSHSRTIGLGSSGFLEFMSVFSCLFILWLPRGSDPALWCSILIAIFLIISLFVSIGRILGSLRPQPPPPALPQHVVA